MRIRSIVPKFWESEDIERLDWDTRLLFVGLWSYADDNGVGRDNVLLIAADLFPLTADPLDVRARVSRGLRALSEGGQITRYTVNGEPLFFVNAWDKYQRVDHKAKERYKRPTSDDPDLTIEIATPSRESRDTLALGEGEKGRRGEGLKTSTPATPEVDPPLFAEFWSAYPRKVQKDDARRAWAKALKRTTADTILAGVRRYASDPHLPDKNFIPYPASWLNAGSWDDEPFPPTSGPARPPQPRGYGLPGERKSLV